MSYDYETEKAALFTDEGQRMLLRIRDRVHSILKTAGAIRMQEAMREECGDSWGIMACVDRLVELGEIKEIDQGTNCFAQHRVFVSKKEL